MFTTFIAAFSSPTSIPNSFLSSTTAFVAADGATTKRGTCSRKVSLPNSRPTSMSMDVNDSSELSRRQFMNLAFLLSCGAASVTGIPEEAQAVNGLKILPLREPLTNTYYLMRACETFSDSMDKPCSNPIDRLSIDKLGLTRRGVKQAMEVSSVFQDDSNALVSDDVWLWPSITVSAYETAEVLASQLRIGRDHIVPEYSFLDPRHLGILNDNEKLSTTMKYVHSNDKLDSNWKPKPNVDGTPNDSVLDVFVRVRQLFSKLETQYFGQNIIIIAPDSDPLSIWQAAVMGYELTSHPTMSYEPGEIRLVKEKVVDAFGNEIEKPYAKTILKPVAY